jgi:hypothetical protein
MWAVFGFSCKRRFEVSVGSPWDVTLPASNLRFLILDLRCRNRPISNLSDSTILHPLRVTKTVSFDLCAEIGTKSPFKVDLILDVLGSGTKQIAQ